MSYLEALTTTLAAEHAAVFVYGALGAQTSQSGQPALYATLTLAYSEHRARRDQLVSMVLDQGGTPVAAEPAYELPADLSTVEAVMGRALRLERSCAATYAFLIANSSPRQRRWPISALTAASVRSLELGGAPEPLPGS